VVARVHADAQAILLQPNTPLPKVLSVRKWSAGIPQYNVGHSDLVESVFFSLFFFRE
jgi:protoporphyrinogen oxidase